MASKCHALTYHCSTRCPLGHLGVVICEHGLHSIDIKADLNEINKVAMKRESFTCDLVLEDCSSDLVPQRVMHHAKRLTTWLNVYFNVPSTVATLPIPDVCPSSASIGGPFTRRVRKALAEEVPSGSTLSYSELAARCGNAKASRAVGQAMRSNPLPILIPCHRVIPASGALGRYSGGGWLVKQWLLNHEGARMNSAVATNTLCKQEPD